MDDIHSLGRNLLFCDFITMQDFCDQLARDLTELTSQPVVISIYSQCLAEENKAAVICSSCSDIDPYTEIDKSKNEFLAIDTPFHKKPLLLISSHPNLASELRPIIDIIRKIIALILFSKRQNARRMLVEISNQTRDANSFAHKILKLIKDQIVYCDDITIFFTDEITDKLYLASTTVPLKKQKENYFYMLHEATPYSICVNEGAYVVHHFAYDQKFVADKPDLFDLRDQKSIILWPIKYANSDGQEHDQVQSQTGGLIQLSNIKRKNGKLSWDSSITDYDWILLNFIAEIVYVVASQYQRANKAGHDFARLTHGIKTTMLASAKKLDLITKTLFRTDKRTGDVSLNFELKPQETERLAEVREFAKKHGLSLSAQSIENFDENDVHREIMNVQAILDETNFQFLRILGHGGERLQISPIWLMGEVLMPLVRVYETTSLLHGYLPPKFNKLTEAKFIKAPSVLSNAEALTSVLRNLVENSMKYTNEKKANIQITYTVEGNKLILHFQDRGIGIGKNEHDLIFVEGYRSADAMRKDNRGIGHGLSYCKDILTSLDSTIMSLPSETGAYFKISLPIR